MKSKILYALLILTPFICVFVMAQTQYGSEALIVFLLNAIVSIIIGIFSIRRKRVLGIILIILGLLSLPFIDALLMTNIEPRNSNAVVKASLMNIKVQAGIIYESANPRTYQNICDDAVVQELLLKIKNKTKSTKCFSGQDKFVVAAEFKEPKDVEGIWCVDSFGNSKSINSSQYMSITGANIFCSQ